ncbi:MAG: chemotaxis protein CheW [Gammaproteobacteria bacterium]|nr:chemotaxis protein CheW [Gammaproteobacteria bacterium]
MEEEIQEMISNIVEAESSNADDVAEKYLSFMVNQEIFAFDVLNIKEIIEYGETTRVPLTPAYIRGVINLRGSVVPVIDLAVRLGKPSSAVTKRTCVVIVEKRYDEQVINLGVTIDSINEVFGVKEEEMEPAPAFGAGIDSLFIKSMVKKENSFITLLDMDKVLDLESLANFSSLNLKQGNFRNSTDSIASPTIN